MISIVFDEDLIDRQMRRLEKVPYAVQRALYPAVSEVLRLARTELAGHLTSDIPLPPRLIEKSIRLSQAVARGHGAEGSLSVAGKAVPLINYDADPQEITPRKGMRSKQWPGFTYSLRSGERRQREEMGGQQFMSGLPFIARMPGGHLGIYYRTVFGQMKEAYGPTVQYHATTPEVEHMLRSGAEENFARILPRIADNVLAERGA